MMALNKPYKEPAKRKLLNRLYQAQCVLDSTIRDIEDGKYEE